MGKHTLLFDFHGCFHEFVCVMTCKICMNPFTEIIFDLFFLVE